jgi:hypothetical protein
VFCEQCRTLPCRARDLDQCPRGRDIAIARKGRRARDEPSGRAQSPGGRESGPRKRQHWALAADLSCTRSAGAPVGRCVQAWPPCVGAQASTRGPSQVSFSLATMLTLISLRILLAALAGFRVFLSLPTFFSLASLPSSFFFVSLPCSCCYACTLPVAMPAFCAIVLCGLCDWGVRLAWGCMIDVEWM